MSVNTAAVSERTERTAQGYRRFRCRTCGKQFNERTGAILNRPQYSSDVIALVVLWRRFCQISCQQASLATARVWVLSGRFQDGQQRGDSAKKTKSVVIGGNMLVAAGPRAEEVAQLTVSSAEPSRRPRAHEPAHGPVSTLNAAMVLFNPVIQVLGGPVSNPLAQLGADRAGIAVVAVGRDPVRRSSRHRPRQRNSLRNS